MSAQSAINLALGEDGYYAPNDPEPGSKYGRWMATYLGQSWLAGPSTSIWWCMIFCSWAVYQSGGALPGGPQFNTDAAASAARSAGRLVSLGDAQPGDLVVFDWNWNSAATDHVGMVVTNHSGWVDTVEGNTSGGSGGSQSAGNGVHRRQRSWEDIRYVIRPDYSGGGGGAAPVAAAPAVTDTDGQLWLNQDGVPGSATYSRWQQVMGTPIDGVIDDESLCVMAFQRFLNTVVSQEDIKVLTGGTQLDADGYLGEKTWKVFQYWFGNVASGHMRNICGFTLTAATWNDWVDGIDGTWTWMALQVALNHSYANSGKLFSK